MKEFEKELGWEKNMITKKIKKKRNDETERRRWERKEKGWGWEKKMRMDKYEKEDEKGPE